MRKRVTELLSAFVKQLLDVYVLAPLLIALPPAALWALARNFITSPHTAPGWVILPASALAGLLVVSVILNIAHWRRARRQIQRNLVVVAHGGPLGLSWYIGHAGMTDVMIVSARFDITNIRPADISVPRTVLEISYPLLGVVPRRRDFIGVGLGDTVIRAESTLRLRLLTWHVTPVVQRKGPIRARVAVVDNFGAHNWSEWATWEYQG